MPFLFSLLPAFSIVGRESEGEEKERKQTVRRTRDIFSQLLGIKFIINLAESEKKSIRN